MEPSAAAGAQAMAYGKAVTAFTHALSSTVKYLEEIEADRAVKTWEKDAKISELGRKAQDALWQLDRD
jgi:hypothetical protein